MDARQPSWQRLHLLDGDEPYLMQQACQQIQALGKQHGFNEHQRLEISKAGDLDDLRYQLNTHSLFADKTLILAQFTTAKLGKSGLATLKALPEAIPSDKCLICLFPKLDASQSKSAWYKALSKVGSKQQIRPIPRFKLPQWVREQLGKHHLQADTDVIELLVDSTEGNLSATAQEIEKLALIYGSGSLTRSQVASAVTNQAEFNVFQIIDSTLAGNAARLLQTLRPLQQANREGILLLALVIKELKRLVAIQSAISLGEPAHAAMQPYRMWDSQKQRVEQVLRRHSLPQLKQLLQQATVLDLTFKGLRQQDPWQGLTHLLLAIAGTRWALGDTHA